MIPKKSTARKSSKLVAPAPTKSVVKKEKKTTMKAVAAAAPVTALESDSQKITLTYFAPQAASVLIAGDFTRWGTAPVSLVKEDNGVWKTTLALKPGKYQYRLLVDGQWQNDPHCQELQPNEFGSANCVLSVAA